MSRKLNDWLTGYLQYTDNTEPPISYHTWVGISVIAGALQRKVYIKWGFDVIYPNMYVVLIGPSGKCRKGTAMGMGQDILNEISIPMTSESVTREALIRKMSSSMGNYTDGDTNIVKFHCSLTCLSEELSVFLGQNDVKFLSDLTNWYDSRDSWKYETKTSGSDHIKGVCFNLLGATAPDWIQSILPQEAIGGGFTSRIIFVVEEKKGKTISDPVISEEEVMLRRYLVDDLNKISNIAGQYRFSDESRDAYKAWYDKIEKDADKGILPIEDPRFSGYCERRATHARKLCMVMSASRGDERIITMADFDRSVQVMKAAEVKMHKTFGGLGRSRYSEAVELILDFMIVRRECTRSELLRRFYRDVDAQTLKIVEEVLTGMGVIKVQFDPNNIENRTYVYVGAK